MQDRPTDGVLFSPKCDFNIILIVDIRWRDVYVTCDLYRRGMGGHVPAFPLASRSRLRSHCEPCSSLSLEAFRRLIPFADDVCFPLLPSARLLQPVSWHSSHFPGWHSFPRFLTSLQARRIFLFDPVWDERKDNFFTPRLMTSKSTFWHIRRVSI